MGKLETLIENQHFDQLKPTFDEAGQPTWRASETHAILGNTYVVGAEPKNVGVYKTEEAKRQVEEVLGESSQFILMPDGDYLMGPVEFNHLVWGSQPTNDPESLFRHSLTRSFSAVQAFPQQDKVDKLHPQVQRNSAMRMWRTARDGLEVATERDGKQVSKLISSGDKEVFGLDTREIKRLMGLRGEQSLNDGVPVMVTQLRSSYILSALYRAKMAQVERTAEGESPQQISQKELTEMVVASAAAIGALLADANIRIEGVRRWKMYKGVWMPA